MTVSELNRLISYLKSVGWTDTEIVELLKYVSS